MLDGLLRGQISFGRGCVHTVGSRVVRLLLIWELVTVPHTSVHGEAWPKLLFFRSAQLFLLFLYLPTVYSDNLTPPAASTKTCVGQEKLSFNIYYLCFDNARSHCQYVVILNVLKIQNKEVAVHCYLLPVSLAHHDARIGKAEWDYPLHFGLFSEPSPCMHVREGAVVIISCCAVGWGCQPNASEISTSCHKVRDTCLSIDWISWRNLVLLLDTQLILLSLVSEGNSPELPETTVISLGV